MCPFCQAYTLRALLVYLVDETVLGSLCRSHDVVALGVTLDYLKRLSGMAASMGAFLLSSGAKGKRFALPNSEIMIHQPLGGMQGQATDIKIHADHILRTKETLNRILAANSGKPSETICEDTERDNFMTAAQAAEYGLIDRVIDHRI